MPAAKLKQLLRCRANISGTATLINDLSRAYDFAYQDQVATQIAFLDELWRDFLATQEEIEMLEEGEEHFSAERRNLQLPLKGSLQNSPS